MRAVTIEPGKAGSQRLDEIGWVHRHVLCLTDATISNAIDSAAQNSAGPKLRIDFIAKVLHRSESRPGLVPFGPDEEDQ